MKILKRYFKMTKEDVEYNMRFMPYFRAIVQASKDIPTVRKETSLTSEEKKKKIREIRKGVGDVWKELNEV